MKRLAICRWRPVQIETPLEPMQAPILSGKKLCFRLHPAGGQRHSGRHARSPALRPGRPYRPLCDPVTLVPVEYYLKLPEDIGAPAIVVDPMLATGHSAVAAVGRLKEAGAAQIKFLCLLAAPEGLEMFQELIPRCRFTRRRSTANSTTTAISSLVSAMPATGFSGRSELSSSWCERPRTIMLGK